MDDADSRRLAEVFRRYPEVAAVYLFGSQATGAARGDSDLDLAVVPRGAGARDRKLDMLADLALEGFDDVDLVILDQGDVVLEYKAIATNRLIYATPDFERAEHYIQAVRRYLDLKPYLDRIRKAYRRRLERGR